MYQATNWLFNFALAYAVPPGLNSIAWKTYFIFGTFNFAAFIHVLFMYPETVGRSLEEVEEIFQQGHVFSAWAIDRNIGVKTLDQVVSDKVSIHSCIEGNTLFIILLSAQRLAFNRRRRKGVKNM